MNSTLIMQKIQNAKKSIFEHIPNIGEIITSIDQSGGRPLLVGGAVRDIFLQNPLKDLDIEIHGLPLEQVERILSRFGSVNLIGKSFGVLCLRGYPIDWAIPRKDSAGRKPKVFTDPHMSLHEAFSRRDLTINAMGIDLITNELVDPFGGLNDLQKGILRVPDSRLFSEDPLRLYRVMQFKARFEMNPDEELNDLCRTMSLKGLSRERVVIEFKKLFTKAARPSLGIRWLKDIGRVAESMPELAATIGIKQNPQWHPEGDVFEHSMQAIDKAAELAQNENDERKMLLVCTALCHDFGKVMTTKVVDGVMRSHGHEIASVKPTKSLLDRLVDGKELKRAICKLVRYHMVSINFIHNGATKAAYKRLAQKLSPETNIYTLYLISIADKLARNPACGVPLATCSVPTIEEFLKRARTYGVDKGPEPPRLQGFDILDLFCEGPELGRALDYAYTLQIEENITRKEDLKKRVKRAFDK